MIIGQKTTSISMELVMVTPNCFQKGAFLHQLCEKISFTVTQQAFVIAITNLCFSLSPF